MKSCFTTFTLLCLLLYCCYPTSYINATINPSVVDTMKQIQLAEIKFTYPEKAAIAAAFQAQAKTQSPTSTPTPLFSATNNGVSDDCSFIPLDGSYTSIPTNDDGSFGSITLPFTFKLFGSEYTSVYINTNGNLTFDHPYSTYNSLGFPMGVPMVAPFWADVDTRNGGQIYYKITASHMIVTWQEVSFYGGSGSPLRNTFQVIIGTESDPETGFGQTISYRYEDMQWTTGNASSGINGFGGTPATVGSNKGNGVDYHQIGRFNQNNLDYDGPEENYDGVHYLDFKCFRSNPKVIELECSDNITTSNDPGVCGAVVNYNPPTVINYTPTELDGFSYQGLFNGNAYFLSDTKATAVNANQTAFNTGGHLATIQSSAENVFVSNFNPNEEIYIGANDVDDEGTFVWVTGEPMNYTNWHAGEPNNHEGDEDWVVLNYFDDYGWNDWNGDEPSYYAVEFEGFQGTIELIEGLGPGATFPIGTTTETWLVTDQYGNTQECSFTVTVTDDEAPQISTPCPSDIEYCSPRNVTWTAPQATDNCEVSTSSTHDSGDFFDYGEHTITYTFSDPAGHEVSCDFTITIEDNDPPVITTPCPNNITLCGAQTVSWIPPQATDECEITTTSTHDSGDFFDVGVHTVTYSFSDVAGNTTSCSFTVTINEVPVVTITKTNPPQWCQGIATLHANVLNSSDLTPPISYEWSHNLGNDPSVLVTSNDTYWVVVTDANDCQQTASYDVNLQVDNITGAYTIIAKEELEASKTDVYTGGVGLIDADETDIQHNTTIHQFLKMDMDHLMMDASSSAQEYIDADANPVLPPFKYNPYYNTSTLTVNSGTTMTLTGSNYGYIKVKAGATLIIDNPNIYIRRIRAYDNVTIIFSQPTSMRVRQSSYFGKFNNINPTGEDVVLYGGDRVKIRQGSDVILDIYTKDELKVNDSYCYHTTTMMGLFIAMDAVFSEDKVEWHANPSCDLSINNNGLATPTNPTDLPQQDKQLAAKINVYPNPTTDWVNIDLNSFRGQKVDVTIKDILGNTVYSKTIEEVNDLLNINMSKTNWNTGLYVITVYSDHHTESKHFIYTDQ